MSNVFRLRIDPLDTPMLMKAIEEEVAQHRGWYIFEGILFIVGGVLAAVLPGVTALTLNILLGVLLLFGGVFRFLGGFMRARGRWWNLLSGLLFAVAGALMLFFPRAGISALIVVIGMLLLAEGFMETLLALSFRPGHNWAWFLFAGIVTLLLGVMVFVYFPTTGVLFMALAVGINMALYGTSLLMLAWRAGRRDKEAHHPAEEKRVVWKKHTPLSHSSKA